MRQSKTLQGTIIPPYPFSFFSDRRHQHHRKETRTPSAKKVREKEKENFLQKAKAEAIFLSSWWWLLTSTGWWLQLYVCIYWDGGCGVPFFGGVVEVDGVGMRNVFCAVSSTFFLP
jgi:hypothetical protein